MNRKLKTAIPSILTMGNLLLGFVAISYAQHDPQLVLLLILAAAILDLFDGLLARLLNAVTETGKQLDSLADMVTFGIAPAVAIWNFMDHSLLSLLLISLLPIFSALRLARFNAIEETGGSFFKGLPTPVNGVFFASLPLVSTMNQGFILFEPYVIPWLIVVFSALMVSPLKMFSLKTLFKKGVEGYFVAAVFVVTFPTALSFGWLAVPIGVIAYILFSVIYTITRK